MAIDEDSILFDGQTILKSDITELKFWISSVEFYKFSIGKHYQIGFKTEKNQIDIHLRSYLGISDRYFLHLFNQILDKVWDPLTQRIFQRNLREWSENRLVNIAGCQLRDDGIISHKQGLIQKERIFILWQNLHFDKKFDRLTFTDSKDNSIWLNLYYKDNWNIEILISLLEYISEEKKALT
ncbi:hypothetical protein [Rufibacter radiotolerans]|uniref:hypothetical protein n=1 Tax=Rufibacter radiotolerans TaxID=1379910 RepID=UPI0018CF8B28|nr:hypothetical protein [Rufibacter radiotolerans]